MVRLVNPPTGLTSGGWTSTELELIGCAEHSALMLWLPRLHGFFGLQVEKKSYFVDSNNTLERRMELVRKPKISKQKEKITTPSRVIKLPNLRG